MASLPVELVFGADPLDTSLQTFYTVPADKKVTITAFAFNNTGALPAKATVHLVKAIDTAGTTNQYVTAVEVPPAGQPMTQAPGLVGQVLPAGASIQMLASTALVINAIASGRIEDA